MTRKAFLKSVSGTQAGLLRAVLLYGHITLTSKEDKASLCVFPEELLSFRLTYSFPDMPHLLTLLTSLHLPSLLTSPPSFSLVASIF